MFLHWFIGAWAWNLDNQLQLEHKVSWSIKAQKGFWLNFFCSSGGSHKEKETFKVSEYVLPKVIFQLLSNFPSRFLFSYFLCSFPSRSNPHRQFWRMTTRCFYLSTRHSILFVTMGSLFNQPGGVEGLRQIHPRRGRQGGCQVQLQVCLQKKKKKNFFKSNFVSQLPVLPRLASAPCSQVYHCRDECDGRWVSGFYFMWMSHVL